jgi:hypothetical protein
MMYPEQDQVKTTEKVKVPRYTPRRRLGGERRYSSYSFSTSALDGSEWSASRPGRALPPGKGHLVLIGQGAGWAPEPVWTQRLEEKYSAFLGDRTPVVQSVVRHFLLAPASRLALGPSQPPIQWVPGVLSPGVKRGRGVTLTTHPHLVPRLRMSRSYASSPPMCLHGV